MNNESEELEELEEELFDNESFEKLLNEDNNYDALLYAMNSAVMKSKKYIVENALGSINNISSNSQVAQYDTTAYLKDNQLSININSSQNYSLDYVSYSSSTNQYYPNTVYDAIYNNLQNNIVEKLSGYDVYNELKILYEMGFKAIATTSDFEKLLNATENTHISISDYISEVSKYSSIILALDSWCSGFTGRNPSNIASSIDLGFIKKSNINKQIQYELFNMYDEKCNFAMNLLLEGMHVFESKENSSKSSSLNIKHLSKENLRSIAKSFVLILILLSRAFKSSKDLIDIFKCIWYEYGFKNSRSDVQYLSIDNRDLMNHGVVMRIREYAVNIIYKMYNGYSNVYANNLYNNIKSILDRYTLYDLQNAAKDNPRLKNFRFPETQSQFFKLMFVLFRNTEIVHDFSKSNDMHNPYNISNIIERLVKLITESNFNIFKFYDAVYDSELQYDDFIKLQYINEGLESLKCCLYTKFQQYTVQDIKYVLDNNPASINLHSLFLDTGIDQTLLHNLKKSYIHLLPNRELVAYDREYLYDEKVFQYAFKLTDINYLIGHVILPFNILINNIDYFLSLDEIYIIELLLLNKYTSEEYEILYNEINIVHEYLKDKVPEDKLFSKDILTKEGIEFHINKILYYSPNNIADYNNTSSAKYVSCGITGTIYTTFGLKYNSYSEYELHNFSNYEAFHKGNFYEIIEVQNELKFYLHFK